MTEEERVKALLKDNTALRDTLMHQTMGEVLNKLRASNKCIMTRPTGFGKTFILSRITLEYIKRERRVLFLYPTRVIRDDIKTKYSHMNDAKHVTFCTYRRLLGLKDEDLKKIVNSYSLIICDEAHMAGAENTKEVLLKMMSLGGNAKYLGATATPDRSDGYDVINEMFDGHAISNYTLNMAIEDGLMPMPYYVCSLYEMPEEIKAAYATLDKYEAIKRATPGMERSGSDYDAERLRLKAIEIEVAKVINAQDSIKKHVTALYGEEVDYLKFIVFFSEKNALAEKYKEVVRWFREAFPHMKVKPLIITSDIQYANKVEELMEMKKEDNVIHIIMCINMLNMGYHISDLNGVVMLRGSRSDIIYKQQFGRSLSVDAEYRPIIFDFVNNYKLKPYYKSSSKKDKNNVNTTEIESRNERLSSIDRRNLIIHDMVADHAMTFNRFRNDRLLTLPVEDAIFKYVNYDYPMKKLAEEFGIREDIIREALIKHGVKVED